MLKIENDCCGCNTDRFPCRGNDCPLRHVPHYYCDNCGEEVGTLYHHEEKELCADCVLETLEIVK